MKDSPAPMLNDEQAVQQAEGGRRNREEVERDDCLAMIPEECQPIPFGIAAPPKPAKITSDGSFGHLESELLQFAMDPGSTPAGVVAGPPANYISNLGRDPRPPSVGARFPAPVPAEPGAVPSYDRIGLDDGESVLPAGPELAQ